MLYFRFPLSLLNVEELLFAHGPDLCHETVHLWWNRFGPRLAGETRWRRIKQIHGFPALALLRLTAADGIQSNNLPVSTSSGLANFSPARIRSGSREVRDGPQLRPRGIRVREERPSFFLTESGEGPVRHGETGVAGQPRPIAL